MHACLSFAGELWWQIGDDWWSYDTRYVAWFKAGPVECGADQEHWSDPYPLRWLRERGAMTVASLSRGGLTEETATLISQFTSPYGIITYCVVIL